ncbi:hypothetical protein QAD02_005190 [Eretmocerus hayati]|uniref:Uncharacterized protein n=1 Tax=Eretmocerus hayati TaxID=131215 RepID=A0ACC2NRW6_9HYME|nr:hypothetical protein QAD02_005190 [Eretmocerus hayati]
MIRILLIIGLAQIIYGGDTTPNSNLTSAPKYNASNLDSLSSVEVTTATSLGDLTTTPINYDDGQVSRAKRIHGGWVVMDMEYPWIVALHSDRSHMQGQCAGSVIAPNLVLTATHCLYEGVRTFWRVRSQRNNLNHVRAVGSGGRIQHEYYFSKIYSHETTYSDKLVPLFDISVIVLEKSIRFGLPIKLSPIDLKIPSGAQAQTFGWGLSDYDLPSENLRTANVWTTPCRNPQFSDRSMYICIESSISSACRGDSGGPLIYNGYLVGIVSAGAPEGIRCSQVQEIFTRVAHYIPWIKKIMEQEAIYYYT